MWFFTAVVMRRQRNIQWIALVWLVPMFSINQASGQVPLPGAPLMASSSISLNQIVTVSVNEISVITVSGDVTLTVSNSAPGEEPDPVVETSPTYALTVNGASKKLSGLLDAEYSAGIALELLLDPPTGGTAQSVVLGTIAQDVISGFGYVAESGLQMTYTATASSQAAPNGTGELRTVTLTLTDN